MGYANWRNMLREMSGEDLLTWMALWEIWADERKAANKR